MSNADTKKLNNAYIDIERDELNNLAGLLDILIRIDLEKSGKSGPVQVKPEPLK